MTETYHQVGNVHTTTMGYNSVDLSSVACMNSLGSGNGSPVKWAPMNYADLYAPIPAARSSSRVAQCFTDPSQAAQWGDYMQNPFISLPQDISNADPLWSTCLAGILGAMDPPSALTAAASMVPIAASQPDIMKPETSTIAPADPVRTAYPGQPIPVPAPLPTAPIGKNGPTLPGSIGPGNSNDSPHAPGHVGPPDPNAPGFLSSASELVALKPAPNTAAPAPDTQSSHSVLQFGPGPGNANPNDMSPAQLSVLHQALAPSPSPAVADPIISYNGGSNGGNPPNNFQPQPEAAIVPISMVPDVQLQPISSAIFNSKLPINNSPQNPNAGNVVPQGNNPPQNNAPGGNNSPPQNNSPQEAQSSNLVQFGGVASPAPAGQGVAADPQTPPAFVRGPDGGLVVGSSTILPGQAATVNNHQVSVGSSNVIVDSNTYGFAPISTPPPSPITIAGLPMQSAFNGGVIIAGQTLASGIQTTISGHAISVGSGNVVVDGNIQILPTALPAPAPQILIGDSPMQRVSNGAIVLGSSTLPIGSQTTTAGHIISVGATNVVVDGTTNALPAPTPAPGSPILLNGQSIQRAPNGGLIIGTSTLLPDTQTTISGHVISVGPTAIVLDSSTYALRPTAGATPIPPSAQSNAITLPNGSVLSPGSGPVTISGSIISVLSNNQGAVIGGSTVLFASPTPQSVFTVGNQVFTAAPSSFVISGVTMSVGGPAVTIAGTVVSLGPSGLQVGSATIPLATTAASTGLGLGPLILSAFGSPSATGTAPVNSGNGINSAPSGTGVKVFTGSGAKLKESGWLLYWTAFVGMGIDVLTFSL